MSISPYEIPGRLSPNIGCVDPAAASYLDVLRAELDAINPKSYEYGVLATTITALATEIGYPLVLPLAGEQVDPDMNPSVPPAFVGGHGHIWC